jgi:ParB family transcriptional regulator, chromosome partitioning protein
MHTNANLIDVPFNKLVLWAGNVRKTGIESGLDELAASIAAHGLINPLLVRKAAKGKYAVIAGQRRYLDLKRLAKAGTLDKGASVSCQLRTEGPDDTELSLAENVVRVAMHPADQFEAWRTLAEKGDSVAEIAVRFGVLESTVRKRLALARVSPLIFAAYREGELDLEALQAFTITDDHATQESVWDNLPDWQRGNARAIRQALTEGDVPCRDRRVRFVGVDAYEAAGGAVRRDLFDPEGGGTVQDAALLDALARRKLDSIAAELLAEGWKWTEARLSFGWDERREFLEAEMDPVPLPDGMQEEADSLQEELAALFEHDDDDDDDHDEEEGDHDEEGAGSARRTRIAAIEARLSKIDAMARVWPDHVKARAGAIVTLAHDGTVEIERGLIRQEDVDAPDSSEDDSLKAEPDDGAAEGSGLSASLIEELSAPKTAALRIERARSPDIALALAVHALAGEAFYHAATGVLKLRLMTRSLRRSIREHESCPAVLALEAECQRIRDMLPSDHAGLWPWCLNAERDRLLDVLAVAAAQGIDAVESKHDANHRGSEEGKALAEALGLDMAGWYRPTAAGYFGRISKAAILSDLKAARQTPGAPTWAKMKKAELAALAERETAATVWLPAPLQ